MTSTLRFCILSLLVIPLFATGCGHVAANYPGVPGLEPLPDTFTTPRGDDTRLVWVEPGRVHGFLGYWRDTMERSDIFQDLAEKSGLEAHRDGVEMYRALSEEGIAEMTVFVFLGKGVTREVETGAFEIRFTDGTVIRDVGVLRVEPRDTETPYRWTRRGPITLSEEPFGRKKALPIIVFAPKVHLGLEVESIALRP